MGGGRIKYCMNIIMAILFVRNRLAIDSEVVTQGISGVDNQ